MLKKDLKCPQCGKTLLRLYGIAVHAVTCRCGYKLELKKHTPKTKTERSHAR
jgi:hypothetical protein